MSQWPRPSEPGKLTLCHWPFSPQPASSLPSGHINIKIRPKTAAEKTLTVQWKEPSLPGSSPNPQVSLSLMFSDVLAFFLQIKC